MRHRSAFLHVHLTNSQSCTSTADSYTYIFPALYSWLSVLRTRKHTAQYLSQVFFMLSCQIFICFWNTCVKMECKIVRCLCSWVSMLYCNYGLNRLPPRWSQTWGNTLISVYMFHVQWVVLELFFPLDISEVHMHLACFFHLPHVHITVSQ